MGIDRQTIDWVSGLAQLDLSEEEKVEMETQLARILDYMDVLNELELDDVAPTAHILGITNVTRKDEPARSFPVETVEKLAPLWAEGHVVVPRIV